LRKLKATKHDEKEKLLYQFLRLAWKHRAHSLM